MEQRCFQVVVVRRRAARLAPTMNERKAAMTVDVLDAKPLRLNVQHVIEAQRHLHKEVLDTVQTSRSRHRASARVGSLLELVMGDYVLVTRVRRRGSTPKLLMIWTGPWRIVTAERPHVYGFQNIVMGEVRDIHVARLRF
ncbi:unnamed protein product [Ectocarpus fasciculatus]